MAALDNSKKTVQVEEEIEGEHTETTDYFFDKIGESVPLLSDDSAFDLQNPPGKPLAVSERFGLIFAAHFSGFCVARTKDVVASAKELKDTGSSSSVQELSVVDVRIGRVHILAISLDSSVLAAVVGQDVHCFSVDSLLQKDEKPFFSCSIESSFVKELLWTKDSQASFMVLTSHGKLLIGAPHKPLENVMEEVDAIGTSLDGSFVAVARKNTLSIYSSKFKDILHISLLLNSLMGDRTTGCTIKVDSIRWVRSDSIMVGCLQLIEDGEENYFVQVIKSRENKFIDGPSTLAAICFTDLFSGIVDDIVPYGCGPHLFTEYLENCELAFVSNRKNTDQHIMLLAWSQEDNQVAVVHIERDGWLPRVELQENGDDNLVLGLCIDKASIYGKVHIKLDDDDEKKRDLPPHCLFICLTLEGKIVFFNFASLAGYQSTAKALSGSSGGVECTPVVGSSSLVEVYLTTDETTKKTSESLELNSRFDENSAGKDLKVSDVKKFFDSDESRRKEAVAGNNKEKALVVADSYVSGQVGCSSKGLLSQFSVNYSLAERSSSAGGGADSSQTLKLGLDQSLVKNLPVFGKSVVEKPGVTVTKSTPFSLGSTGPGTMSHGANERSPYGLQSGTGNTLSGGVLTSVGASNNAGNSIRPSDMSSLIEKTANHGQKAPSSSVRSDMPFGMSTSKMPSQESISLRNSNTRHAMKNSFNSFPSAQLNFEQESSKQYCNVQNMASELDKLLECIEEKEGFIYACTTAHRNSLETLEEGMESLSERTRGWQSFMEERLKETQLLLDKTIQVLAQEKHMEGLVKQTTDKQYCDLWNRQKLSPELELKQQNVLNQSQDLINQMIELEKHFNNLELNLYGERSSIDKFSRPLTSRSTSSRQIQSVQAIHNATVSQLTTAQHLSELLSQQMAALNVKSPPAKQENVKKKLLESIGISEPVDYIGSANTGKTIELSSNKSPLVSSLGSARSESRRSLSSNLGNHDPEAARRRRDSLDRNWVKLETPRTTVKRMLIENESHKVNSSISSRINQIAGPCKLQGSMAPYPKFLAVQNGSGEEDTQIKHRSEIMAASTFKWATTISDIPLAKTEERPSLQVLQGNSFSVIPDKSAASPVPALSFSAPLVSPNIKVKNNLSNTERTRAQIRHVGKPEPVEQVKPSGQPLVQEKENNQKMQPQLLFSPIKSGSFPVTLGEETPLTAPVSGRSPLMGPQFSPAFGSSAVQTSSKSASVSTPEVQSLATSVENESVSSANLVKDGSSQALQLPSFGSSASSLVADVKSKDSRTVEIQPMTSFMSPAKEPLKAALKSSTEKVAAEINTISTPLPSQKSESSPSSGLKFDLATSSVPPSEAPRQEVSGIFFALNKNATLASDTIQSTRSEKTSAEISTLPLPMSNSGFMTGGKNVVETPISHEDEMDEEAPETNEISNLSLGSLGGFGIGSSPSATTSRPNPFGASVTSSPVAFTVPSGELFRPASFSFQSLQPSQQTQPPNLGVTSVSFGSATPPQQPPSGSGFGQPGQIGQGQQALGSVLGSFGQSRQLGAGLPGATFGGAQSTGGFLNASAGGGFGGASATGGFAGIQPTVGGFANAATSGGGFAGAASGVGFAGAAGGVGFAGAAGGVGFAGAAGGGAGFGAFSQQGTNSFSTMGGGASSGGRQPASNLFTQIRK